MEKYRQARIKKQNKIKKQKNQGPQFLHLYKGHNKNSNHIIRMIYELDEWIYVKYTIYTYLGST